MKIRGTRISKWWLVALFAVVGAVAVPPLLIGCFAVNNLAGAILGPPAIWSRPWKSPQGRDIAGLYHETERHWQGNQTIVRATLQLNNDGTMTINQMPDSDGQTTCLMTGSGRWKIAPDDGSQIDLVLEKYDSSATCKIGGLPYGISGVLSVAGHAKPYKLYWTLGDPDSGEGVWLRKD